MQSEGERLLALAPDAPSERYAGRQSTHFRGMKDWRTLSFAGHFELGLERVRVLLRGEIAAELLTCRANAVHDAVDHLR